jgi:hypothetical protein
MKRIKRPKLENLEDYECTYWCNHGDWPCSCDKKRGKAYRNNVSVNQAKKLKVLDQIEERAYGVWLVCNEWYWHPNSRLGRPIGRGGKYQKFKNFTAFWKHIQGPTKAYQMNNSSILV